MDAFTAPDKKMPPEPDTELALDAPVPTGGHGRPPQRRPPIGQEAQRFEGEQIYVTGTDVRLPVAGLNGLSRVEGGGVW